MAELLEGICEVTTRDTLDGGAAGTPEEGAMSGGTGGMDGVSREVVLKSQEQVMAPAGASIGTPLAESQPRQQQGHSCQNATHAITRAGTEARSILHVLDTQRVLSVS